MRYRQEGEWVLMLSGTKPAATPERVAGLLALLIMDEAAGVLPITLLPGHPGSGIMLPSGHFVTQHNEPLRPEVAAEVTRIAGVMQRDHTAYVEAICRVLLREPDVPGFAAKLDDPFPKGSPRGEGPFFYGPLPPFVPVRIRGKGTG